MKYEDFLENYPFELQLIDALDQIKDLSPDAAETLNRWASRSTNEKNASKHYQMDPNLEVSPLNTQSP